jgi:hypothetical protein
VKVRPFNQYSQPNAYGQKWLSYRRFKHALKDQGRELAHGADAAPNSDIVVRPLRFRHLGITGPLRSFLETLLAQQTRCGDRSRKKDDSDPAWLSGVASSEHAFLVETEKSSAPIFPTFPR